MIFERFEKIASRYKTIITEGEAAMGGEILDYPAKTARREGLAEGRSVGIKAFILEKVDAGVNDSVIVEKLIKYFQLEEEQAWDFLKEVLG